MVQCFSFKTFCKHLYFRDYEYRAGNVPWRRVKFTAILYAAAQALQYFLWFIIQTVILIGCETNKFVDIDAGYLFVNFPGLMALAVVMGIIVLICFILSTFGLFSLHMLLRYLVFIYLMRDNLYVFVNLYVV